MIELRDISAGYGGGDVVHGISLTAVAGTVTVLCGPNGCGKSTLLKVAGRLLRPRSGQLLVAGEETADLSRRAFARRVALLAQSRSVPSLTALSLVMHGRFPYLGYPRRYSQEDRAIALAALGRLGAAEFWDVPLQQLSGGQRQKVYLAMALAQDTPVLLLDEPTTYLDIAHQLELMVLCQDLAAEGRTVVMVLHDLDLALRFSHQVVLMSEGRLAAQGTPGEIFQSGVIETVFSVSVRRMVGPEGEECYCFHQQGR